MIAVDTETTGLDFFHGCKPFIVSACDEKENLTVYEWEVDPVTREPIIPKEELEELEEFLTDQRIVFHNIKFDIRALSSIGIYLRDWERYEDTAVATHCLDSKEPHGLKELAFKYLDIDDTDQEEMLRAVRSARSKARKKNRKRRKRKEELWRMAEAGDPHFPGHLRRPKEGWSVNDMWLPRAVAIDEEYEEDHPWHTVTATYASLDVVRTIQLWQEIFKPALEEEKLTDQYREAMNQPEVAYAMESRGVTIFYSKIPEAKEEAKEEAFKHEDAALKALGKEINIGSHDQLKGALFGTLGCPVVRRTKAGNPSVDKNVLKELGESASTSKRAIKFIDGVLGYRKLKKSVEFMESYDAHSKKTYCNGKQSEIIYRLHASFNQTGTPHTRYSCSDPNLQQIPKKDESAKGFALRSIFGPMVNREWWGIDYEQLQLRIFAALSQEQEMIDAFNDGWDAHNFTAYKIFDTENPTSTQRRTAKNVNFGFIFGAQEEKINLTAGIPGLMDTVREMFPNAATYAAKVADEVYEKGYIETNSGYRITIPKKEARKAINWRVAGEEGIIVKRAMKSCHDYLKKKQGYLTLQIHDELVFDVPEKWNRKHLRKLCSLMEEAGDSVGITTPVSVDLIRKDWSTGETLAL